MELVNSLLGYAVTESRSHAKDGDHDNQKANSICTRVYETLDRQ
jgi:hypothetical protein